MVFALGDGDAAGEGLTTGLALLAGVLLGEGETAGDGLFCGEALSVVAGSQAIENTIAKRTIAVSAALLISFVTEFFMIHPSFQLRLKSGMIFARRRILSNECSHSCFRGFSTRYELKPSF